MISHPPEMFLFHAKALNETKCESCRLWACFCVRVQLGNNWTHFQGHIDVIYLAKREKQQPEPHSPEISGSSFVLHGSVFLFTLFLQQLWSFFSLFHLVFVLSCSVDDKKGAQRRRSSYGDFRGRWLRLGASWCNELAMLRSTLLLHFSSSPSHAFFSSSFSFIS